MQNQVRTEVQQGQFPKTLIAIIVFLILLNSLVLALAVGIMEMPGEMSVREQAQQGGLYVYEYVQDMARDADVENKPAVREVLAAFRYEIEQTSRPEEMARIVLRYGREAQEVVTREQENQRRDLALSLIRQEARLQAMAGEATITISRQEEGGLAVHDPANLLSPETVETIQEHEGLQRLSQVIEIRVVDGKAELVNPVSMLERMRSLEREVDSLRLQLQETKTAAGLAPMTGPGIVVRLYDAEGGMGSDQIIHDFDVRDIVNELFAAGAAGIAVNNQRLIATSSIRCAGPVILVNQKPIAVNPVTIRAIGDPEILASSLDLIRSEYHLSGIRFEVEKEERISLPAY